MADTTLHIERMLDFSVARGLIPEADRAYARNLLMAAVHLDAPEQDITTDARALPPTLTETLSALCDAAAERGLLTDSLDERERFGALLCGLVTPSPAEVRRTFWDLKGVGGVEAATDWFYQLCRANDYIRVDQIAKNRLFWGDSKYGPLEITINLSKPEKDPRDIAAQKNAPQVGYPKCMLCVENPGYAGRPGYPARQNHRMIPLSLGGQPWHFQYSPYLYYDEHCIVLNEKHVPMHVDTANLSNMFDFVDQFPHYFIGSNADLPIVGGSILSHDHFQGGRHMFPMDKAEALRALSAPVPGVAAEVVNWPMSCVRLRGRDAGALKALADQMLSAWRGHSDESAQILAHTDQPHNTITPVLRRDGDEYVLSLVLRNNRTSAEHPLGIFHPHADLHHIKKENIGLIEVMGLFILPGRLLTELDELAEYLTGARDVAVAPAADSPLAKHYEWVQGIASCVGTRLDAEQAQAEIRKALSVKCARVLEDAGVFKLDAEGQNALLRFLSGIGYRPL